MNQKVPLLLASNNRGKLREIQALMQDAPFYDQVTLCLPADLGIKLDVDETGSTYTENASLKARAFFDAARQRVPSVIVLADDSGLEVDALNGEPGIHSARYLGKPGATDADRRGYLCDRLRASGAPRPWNAHFHCTLVLIDVDGIEHDIDGDCPGEIIPDERGENGFGYDPIFLLPERGLTMAELPDGEKNRISHRGRAVKAALPLLEILVDDMLSA